MYPISILQAKEAPVLDTKVSISITALAPLSLVDSLPGGYYRSRPAPTKSMLLGLIENALGWHFSEKERKAIIKTIPWGTTSAKPTKTPKKLFTQLGQFLPLLQHHIQIEHIEIPPHTVFQDLSNFQLTRVSNAVNKLVTDITLADPRIRPALSAVKAGSITLSDTNSKVTPGATPLNFKHGDVLRIQDFGPYVGATYASPVNREYVSWSKPCRLDLHVHLSTWSTILPALLQPDVPLYLGHSEGWVFITNGGSNV
jgi:hypothetical protein